MKKNLCDPPSKTEYHKKITSIEKKYKNKGAILKYIMNSKKLMDLAHCRNKYELNEARTSQVAKAIKTKTVDILDKIYKSAASYYGQPQIDSSSNITACRFPESIDWTPKSIAYKNNDKKFKTDPSPWAEVVWSALNFQISNEHYNQYKIESSGTLGSAKTTLSARVDPDYNNKYTVYSRTIQGDPKSTMAGCKAQSNGSEVVETTE